MGHRTVPQQIVDSLGRRDLRPDPAEDGIPYCSEECPSHDGKRCRLIGSRAPNVCEPMSSILVSEVLRLRVELRIEKEVRRDD